ncbi:hypothetical protein B0H14DRAFT_3883290 [Mycena olivaceomarginata]|nr:hypothetical protein B0H14DRAFT_3883290 [Mycena olivaceomarginata]
MRTDRANAQVELLVPPSVAPTTVLNSTGLWGGPERGPQMAPASCADERRADKGSLHLIHGFDLARAIVTGVHYKRPRKRKLCPTLLISRFFNNEDDNLSRLVLEYVLQTHVHATALGGPLLLWASDTHSASALSEADSTFPSTIHLRPPPPCRKHRLPGHTALLASCCDKSISCTILRRPSFPPPPTGGGAEKRRQTGYACDAGGSARSRSAGRDRRRWGAWAWAWRRERDDCGRCGSGTPDTRTPPVVPVSAPSTSAAVRGGETERGRQVGSASENGAPVRRRERRPTAAVADDDDPRTSPRPTACAVVRRAADRSAGGLASGRLYPTPNPLPSSAPGNGNGHEPPPPPPPQSEPQDGEGVG